MMAYVIFLHISFLWDYSIQSSRKGHQDTECQQKEREFARHYKVRWTSLSFREAGKAQEVNNSITVGNHWNSLESLPPWAYVSIEDCWK